MKIQTKKIRGGSGSGGGGGGVRVDVNEESGWGVMAGVNEELKFL